MLFKKNFSDIWLTVWKRTFLILVKPTTLSLLCWRRYMVKFQMSTVSWWGIWKKPMGRRCGRRKRYLTIWGFHLKGWYWIRMLDDDDYKDDSILFHLCFDQGNETLIIHTNDIHVGVVPERLVQSISWVPFCLDLLQQHIAVNRLLWSVVEHLLYYRKNRRNVVFYFFPEVALGVHILLTLRHYLFALDNVLLRNVVWKSESGLH